MTNPQFTSLQGAIIKAPDGMQWRIGERVGIWGAERYPSKQATLASYIDGSWEPNDDAAIAAYFGLNDGWMVRPYLMCKLDKAQ